MGQTASEAKRSERLDARVTPQEKRIIESAARLRGISVTDLLRTSVTDAATFIIHENEILNLAGRSRKIFVDALLNPPTEQSGCRSGKALQAGGWLIARSTSEQVRH